MSSIRPPQDRAVEMKSFSELLYYLRFHGFWCLETEVELVRGGPQTRSLQGENRLKRHVPQTKMNPLTIFRIHPHI